MYYPAGGQTYNLSGSISSTATSITLSSFLVPVSGEQVTMALMNTDIAYGTISPKTTSSEFISFTGITANADGTSTLTGVTRGLNKTYPFTTSATFKLPHSGQSQFILSDAPQVFNKYGALDNDAVITGQWEAPDPLTDQGLVTNAYMLALINGGAVSVNALIVSGLAGETIVAGNIVYLKVSDHKWWKADADLVATIDNVILGIAQGAGSAGSGITGGILLSGVDSNQSGLTSNSLVYIGNTAGALSSTSGTITRIVAVATSTTTIIFNTDFNKAYKNFAVDSVGTDSYAITLQSAFGAYYAGMQVTFQAGTANTGACTLNVNGLGAKTIKKNVTDDLATGDILLNQIVSVEYDGTNFQMANPRIVDVSTQSTGVLPIANGGTGLSTTASYYASGVISRDMTAASGAVTTAHGLGVTPKRIKLTAFVGSTSTSQGDHGSSTGTYDGSTNKGIAVFTGVGSAGDFDNSTSYILRLGKAGTTQTAVATFDATNITLTWTKNGGPTSTAEILWEAWGY